MIITATKAVENFNCLQADCPDTCCKGWSMQLDDKTFAKYQDVGLQDAVAYDGENQEIRVMKRDSQTDYCVKFTDGICGIHAKFGAEMLGDACNFYPRVTRKFGEQTTMTATMSCPEIARLMMFTENPSERKDMETDRLPANLRDYLPDAASAEAADKVHNIFLQACEEATNAEQAVARIYSAAQSLQYIPQSEWGDAAAFMIKMADGKLPQAIPDKANNYKLLQILAGIIHATKKKRNERLEATLLEIQKAVGVIVNWQDLSLISADAGALDWSLAKWKKNAAKHDALLKKFVQALLSFGSFPYAGLGENIAEKAKLLIFRFAITKLALMGLPEDASEEDIVRSIQSISRILDHLGDAKLVLNLLEESGWNNDSRICGLIEG